MAQYTQTLPQICLNQFHSPSHGFNDSFILNEFIMDASVGMIFSLPLQYMMSYPDVQHHIRFIQVSVGAGIYYLAIHPSSQT